MEWTDQSGLLGAGESSEWLRNPNIMWPWWHEIMRKKEKGEIPMNMPGYMLAKFRNECEEKWTSGAQSRRPESAQKCEEHLEKP